MKKNVLTFTKNRNDSNTMERIKMTKWLNYYGTEGVLINWAKHGDVVLPADEVNCVGLT